MYEKHTMELQLVHFVFLPLLYSYHVHGLGMYPKTYVTDGCNLDTVMRYTSFGTFEYISSSTSSSISRANNTTTECTATYDAYYTYDYGNFIRYQRFYIDVETISPCKSSEYNVLYIFDGNPRELVASISLNENNPVESKFSTTSRYLTFMITVTDPKCRPRFTIRYTIFYSQGECVPYSQYECSNHRCIDDMLTCDGYDNCGNLDDETGQKCWDTGIIIGITFACIMALCLCCCGCLMCCSLCSQRSGPGGSRSRSAASTRSNTPELYHRELSYDNPNFHASGLDPPPYSVAVVTSSTVPMTIPGNPSSGDAATRPGDETPPPSYSAFVNEGIQLVTATADGSDTAALESPGES